MFQTMMGLLGDGDQSSPDEVMSTVTLGLSTDVPSPKDVPLHDDVAPVDDGTLPGEFPPAGDLPAPDVDVPAPADEASPFDDDEVLEEVRSQGYRMVEGIAGISEQIAHLEAARLRLIAELYSSDYMRPLTAPPSAHAEAKRLDRPLRDLDRYDTTRAELMARLYLRPSDARRLVETAVALTTRFPKTLAALSEGELDLVRAQIIGELGMPLADHHYDAARKLGTSPEDAETAAATIAGLLEEHILKKASTQGPTNLRDCLNRAVHRLDPDYATRTTRDNLASRQVTYRTNRGEGTGDLYAHLGDAEGQGVYAVLDSYARAARYGGSERSLNELRADALTHLILYGHMPDGSTPTNPLDIDIEDATIVPQVDPNTGDIQRDPTDPHCPPASQKINFFAKRPAQPGSNTTEHADEATPDNEPRRGSGTTTMNGAYAAVSTKPETASVNTVGQSRCECESGCNGGNGNAGSGRGGCSRGSDGTGANNSGSGSSGGDWSSSGGAGRNANRSGEGGSGCAGGLYSRSGLCAHVQITVGLNTLLGVDDEPAELAGHGPITAATARDLAFTLGSTWRRLVTDPVTGYLLDYGRKTYRPPAALADHVRARDVTCRTPNCTRPASHCDLDHVISWPAGATSEQNLATRCDIDHRLKHEGRWRHQLSTDPQHPPGTIVMVSPTGHVCLSRPHDYTDPWPERPPRKPNPPDLPSSSDLPDLPSSSDVPDPLGSPSSSEVPDPLGSPSSSEVPDSLGSPSSSDVPDSLGSPSPSGIPSAPSPSGAPGTPGPPNPSDPRNPSGAPGAPNPSDPPDPSCVPGALNPSGTPDTPGAPKPSGAPNPSGPPGERGALDALESRLKPPDEDPGEPPF